MDDRTSRNRRPQVERAEGRLLLSAITNVMATTNLGHQHSVVVKQTSTLQYFEQTHSFPVRAGANAPQGTRAGRGSNGNNGAASNGFAPFNPSPASIANPVTNQGIQGTNFALQPVGTLTPAERKSELFVAQFRGSYTVTPGRTNLEKAVTLIKGVGRGTSFLHGDIQFRIVTPNSSTYTVPVTTTTPGFTVPATTTTPTFTVPSTTTTAPVTMNTQLGGVLAIFDRNLNSNSVLGLDAAGAFANIDAAGHPVHFDTVTIDVNASAGIYDEAFSQGTIDVRYTPSPRHPKNVSEQGFAVVTIQAQIYGPNVAYILTNSNINPGGPRP